MYFLVWKKIYLLFPVPNINSIFNINCQGLIKKKVNGYVTSIQEMDVYYVIYTVYTYK